MITQSAAIGADVRKARHLRRQRAAAEAANAPLVAVFVPPSLSLQSEPWTVGRVCPDESVIAILPKHVSFDGTTPDSSMLPPYAAHDEASSVDMTGVVIAVEEVQLDREVSNILSRSVEFQTAMRDEVKMITDITSRQQIQETAQAHSLVISPHHNDTAIDVPVAPADSPVSPPPTSTFVDTPPQPSLEPPSLLIIAVDEPSTLALSEDIDGITSPERFLTAASPRTFAHDSAAISSALSTTFHLRVVTLDAAFWFAAVIFLPLIFSSSLVPSSLFAITDCITRHFTYSFAHKHIRRSTFQRRSALLGPILTIHFAVILGCFSLAQAIDMSHRGTLERIESIALLTSILTSAVFVAASSTLIKCVTKHEWMPQIAAGNITYLGLLTQRLDICKTIGVMFGPIIVGLISTISSVHFTIIMIGTACIVLVMFDLATIAYLHATRKEDVGALSSKQNVDSHHNNASPKASQVNHSPSPPLTHMTAQHSPSYINTSMNERTNVVDAPVANTTDAASFMYPTSQSMMTRRFILPAIANALLSVNVIAFGAALCAYLESNGHSNMTIALGRALTMGVSALAISSNTFVHSIGCERIGIIAVWINAALVASVVALYTRYHVYQSATASTGDISYIVAVIAVSMASAFATSSFRSAESSLLSDADNPHVDGHVHTVSHRSLDREHASFQHVTRGLSTCGLCVAYMLTVTWNDPADFVYPIVVSSAAAFIAAVLYSTHLWRNRSVVSYTTMKQHADVDVDADGEADIEHDIDEMEHAPNRM